MKKNKVVLFREQSRTIIFKYSLLGIIIFCFILSCSSLIQAKPIWRIGLDDGGHGEFFPDPPYQQTILPYEVPVNWADFNKDDWKSFPHNLYPPEDSRFPLEEIHIIYEYQRDYRCPILRIKAYILMGDSTQRLLVSIGDVEDDPNVSTTAEIFPFILGPKEKGEVEKITIKNYSIYDNYNKPIFFDYLELDDQDQDGDGSFDSEEAEGNTDSDEIEDIRDPDTAALLVQNYTQLIKKRIILDIEEEGDPAPYFQMLTPLDVNSSIFSTKPPGDLFFQYGLFKVNIYIPGEEKEIRLRIIYPKILYSLGQFYLYNYHRDEVWHQEPIKINEKSLTISLKTNNEGSGEEKQQRASINEPRVITITGGLAYPREMDVTLEKTGCFISTFSWSFPVTEFVLLFISFILIFSLSLRYFREGLIIADNQNKNHFLTSSQTKSTTITLVAILLFIFFAQPSALAIDIPKIKMNATPNPVGSGARALGRGGAFISIADDATAASWNPAALLMLKRPEISLVVSSFSGRNTYPPLEGEKEGEIKDLFHNEEHLNYVSLAFPCKLFQRNMVFSINYQHLYEFSQDINYTFTLKDNGLFNIPMKCRHRQKGTLNTISPALALEIIPSPIPTLYIGLTANFWLDEELNAHWENITTMRSDEGAQVMFAGGPINIDIKEYERNDFSGFNTHLGLLWQPNGWLTLGGIIKTPFKADIRRKTRSITLEEYPLSPVQNNYIPKTQTDNLTLKMPISYGLGGSIRFFDKYLIALDIYRTHWEDYLLYGPNGETINPINNKPKNEANIKPTTQIRLGAEYIAVSSGPVISIRCGLFYDPEPARGSADDFYGSSLGTGIKFKNVAFDIAYQYRFGHKKTSEVMLGEEISSDIRQHYLYTSMIFYF